MRASWRMAAFPVALTVFSAALIFATQCAVGERGCLEAEGQRGPTGRGATEDLRVDGMIRGDLSMSGLLEALGPVSSGRVRTSSPEEFLDDLRSWQLEAARAGEGPCISVEFEERASLPALAEDVLKTYAGVQSASLVASGYLDLRGNAWGAVLRGGAAWCDVLFVTTEDDSVSRVQVTRVLPGQ